MKALPHVIAVRCNYCSRELPEFRVHRITNHQVICEYCLEWHFHALDFLGGEGQPKGCQECGATWEQIQLAETEPGVAGRVFVVPKDGIYQMLCRGCTAPYVGKRSDLYRGTEFGAKILKVG